MTQEVLSFDIPSLATLPDSLLEGAISLAMDKLTEQGRTAPLEALAGTIDLMQAVNMELLKAYLPAQMASARADAITVESGGTSQSTRADTRRVGVITRLAESTVKLGVARTKVEDEIRRRSGKLQ
jgi:hypothetical protein